MISVNDLGFGFPTFEQFQVMLRDYERDIAKHALPNEEQVRAIHAEAEEIKRSAYEKSLLMNGYALALFAQNYESASEGYQRLYRQYVRQYEEHNNSCS